MTVGLFTLGRGLQYYSPVVLCFTYSLPTITILRRIEMYQVKSELTNKALTLEQKIEIAQDAVCLKPIPDKMFLANTVVIFFSVCLFFVYNEVVLSFAENGASLSLTAIVPAMVFASVAPLEAFMIHQLKPEKERVT